MRRALSSIILALSSFHIMLAHQYGHGKGNQQTDQCTEPNNTPRSTLLKIGCAFSDTRAKRITSVPTPDSSLSENYTTTNVLKNKCGTFQGFEIKTDTVVENLALFLTPFPPAAPCSKRLISGQFLALKSRTKRPWRRFGFCR